MVFVVRVALRRCAREPAMAALALSAPRCAFSTLCHEPPHCTTLRTSYVPATSSSVFQPAASPSTLLTARRFGSGASRSPATRKGRGRGRGRGAGNTQRPIPTKAEHPSSASLTAAASTSVKIAKEEDFMAAARQQRAAAKPRSRVSAEAADEDEEAEEGSVGVPTLTEDPTAPMQADDDDVADDDAARAAAAAAAEEAEETRIDGVDETTPISFSDTSESPGKHRSVLAEGEGGEGEGEEMAEAAPTAAATEDASDTTAADNDEANRFLSNAFPEYAAEYTAAGPKANPIPVAEVRVDSAEVVAWRCPGCSKTWRCGVFVRCILKNSCPACTAAHTTTMATTRPDLLQLWDYSRNNPFVKPDEIAADSREMVHWSCPTCGDSYTARVRDRVMDKVRCPTCALSQSTSAAATAADSSALQQEWHPLKNGDLRLDQLAPLDRKTKVWWLCGACGHEWEASLAVRLSRHRRVKGKSCPVCHGKGTTDVV